MLRNLVKFLPLIGRGSWRFLDGKKTLTGGVAMFSGLLCLFFPSVQLEGINLIIGGAPLLIGGLLHKAHKQKKRRKEMDKYLDGVDHTLNQDEIDIFRFVANVGQGLGNMIDFPDSSVLEKILYFREAFEDAVPAIQGMTNAKISNLRSKENRDAAVAILKDEFDLKNDEAELKAEKILDGIEVILDIIFTFSSLKR